MQGRLKKSTVVALGAAVAAVGLSSHVQAQSTTLTYVLSINDDGFGDYTPGAFAVFAVDGSVQYTGSGTQEIATSFTLGSDGGLIGYGLSIANAINLNDDLQSGSQYSSYSGLGQVAAGNYYTVALNSTTTKVKTVAAGFTDNSNDTSNSIQASQDTAHGDPTPSVTAISNGAVMMIPIFGLGQSSGDMYNSVPTPSGYVIGGTSNTKAAVPPRTPSPGNNLFSGPSLAPNPSFLFGNYLTGLLVADGTYANGSLPMLSASGDLLNQNILFTNPYEAYNDGFQGEVAALTFMTETLGVPEPASVGLIGVGAMALLARRRRRQAPTAKE